MQTVAPEPGGAERHHDDAALMAAVARRDNHAFSRLYEAHRRRLYRVAYGVLLDAGEAREAVQEAFLRLHQAAPSWEPRAQVGTWLYRVVLNHCLVLRQLILRLARPMLGSPAAVASPPSPETRAVLGEAVSIVERSLASLPPKQRAAACLFLEAELPPAEIAVLLDMTPNAARVTVHRALTCIRADLAERGIDALPTPDETTIEPEAI